MNWTKDLGAPAAGAFRPNFRVSELKYWSPHRRRANSSELMFPVIAHRLAIGDFALD